MDEHFHVTFVIRPGFIALHHQIEAIRQTLSECFVVREKHHTLEVHDHAGFYECLIRFEIDDDY